MAQVDVTELLVDPDFIDDLTLINRVPQMNSRGELILTETSTPTVGSVQPASGKALNRIPEALREVNMSSFWVKAEIVASSPGKYAAILVFRGRRYQVKNVFDWMNFGEGWCEGLCVGEVPAP